MFLNASNLSTTLYDFVLNLAINDKIDRTNYFLKCQYMGRMEVYFKNIISDHFEYFSTLLEDFNVSPDYFYSPSKLSNDLYGTPDLDFLILYFSNTTHPSEFNKTKIKILPESKLELILNGLKNLYSGEVYNNRVNIINYK